MDNILVVVFDSGAQAHEGYRALEELHTEDHLTLYSMALLWRQPSGQLTVEESLQPRPTELVCRLATGGVTDLPGPVGTVAAAEILDHVGRFLETGQAAVVAEVQELRWDQTDSRLEAVGGRVYRRAASVAVRDQIRREVASMRADIVRQEVERLRAEGGVIAELGERVDAARAELEKAHSRARDWIETTRRQKGGGL